MLGNKRRTQNRGRNKSNPNKNQNFKNHRFSQKPLSDRLKNIKDDEEILSGSDDDHEGIDDEHHFNNNESFDQEDKLRKSKKESNNENTDEKRLRIAKKLISRIGEEFKNDENEINTEVDNYIMEEIKKEKNEYFLELSNSPHFNPTESAFLKGHLSSITSLDVSSDSNQVISCSKDCRAIKWDLSTGKKLLLPQFTKKPLYTCIYTPDYKYALFAGGDKHIHQMDLHNEKIVQSFRAHNDTVTSLIFDKNKDQYYSVSNDNTLKVWGVGSTQKSILLETFYGHINKINDIDTMSPLSSGISGKTVNRLITCGSDKLIHLWKVDSQSFLQFKESETPSSYDCIRGLNNDYFISGSYDGNLNLWRTNKKKPISSLHNAHGFEKSLNINHDFFMNTVDEDSNNHLQMTSSNAINIPFPILSLACVKNSDLIFSGSLNGMLNMYKYSKISSSTDGNVKYTKDTIELFKHLPLNERSCINVIKVSKDNKFLILGHGKDGRLGRWDCQNKAKNGISIIKLFDK